MPVLSCKVSSEVLQAVRDRATRESLSVSSWVASVISHALQKVDDASPSEVDQVSPEVMCRLTEVLHQMECIVQRCERLTTPDDRMILLIE